MPESSVLNEMLCCYIPVAGEQSALVSVVSWGGCGPAVGSSPGGHPRVSGSTAGALSTWNGPCDQCHIPVCLLGSSHLLGGWGGHYRCTGAIFQGFLILNVLSLKLLIEVSGCSVSMAAVTR